MASDDDSKSKTKERMTCTLGVVTIRYLDMLSGTGVHGNDVPDVMTKLIEMGIRQAIAEEWIGRIPPGG
jgi:hypothetical protein